jgi:hypothetical protein
VSESLEINGRRYNFDYKQQEHRTLVVISTPWSEESLHSLNEEMSWDDADNEVIMRLRKSLGQSLAVTANENPPRMLFVQQKEPDGELRSVPVEELKKTIKTCLDSM